MSVSKIVLILATLFFSISSFSMTENGLRERLSDPSSLETPYEILKKAFNEAGPATISDFPDFSEVKSANKQPLHTLVWVSQNTKREELAEDKDRRTFFAKITVELSPYAGPLFPQKTETFASILTASLENLKTPVENEIAQVLRENEAKIIETPTGLLALRKDGIVSEFRKQGNLIYIYSRVPGESEEYSYCWQ